MASKTDSGSYNRHVTVQITVVIKTDSGSYNRHVTVQITVVIKTDSGSYNRRVAVHITWQVKQTVVVKTDKIVVIKTEIWLYRQL